MNQLTGKRNTFENNIKLFSGITQNKHFDQHLETRIVTDASTSGLGASLEQYSPEGWVRIAYASRFFEIPRGKIFSQRTRITRCSVGN